MLPHGGATRKARSISKSVLSLGNSNAIISSSYLKQVEKKQKEEENKVKKAILNSRIFFLYRTG